MKLFKILKQVFSRNSPECIVHSKGSHQFENIFEQFSAQLGEIVFHSLTVDPRIVDVTKKHANQIKSASEQAGWDDLVEKKFLEIGANAHYTGQLLAANFGCTSTMLDISPNALQHGRSLAKQQGVAGEAILVGCDYHNLPFHDEYFDIVFIAAAIHHSKTPDIVLKQCLRVLKPGGIFVVEEEPCQRLFSLYKFCTNREEEFTPFEKHLAENEILRVITRASYGTRVEELFDVVENDQIPLSLYLNLIGEKADVLNISLSYKVFMGDWGEELVANNNQREEELAGRIRERINNVLDDAQVLYTQKEEFLGFVLPTQQEIQDLSLKMALALKSLPPVSEKGLREHALVDIFGGVLSLVSIKKGETSKTPARQLFARSMSEHGQVWVEDLFTQKKRLCLSEALLPDIQKDTKEVLFRFFDPKGWGFFTEHNGVISMLNKSKNPSVYIPNFDGFAILLVRFYAVSSSEKPYRILVFHGDRQIDELTICQSETRLIRSVLLSGEKGNQNEIYFQLRDLSDSEIFLREHIRVCVFQIIPITD